MPVRVIFACALNVCLHATSRHIVLGVYACVCVCVSHTDDVCEHLVLGGATGDVVVVDADHGGTVTARFPAFKQQPI